MAADVSLVTLQPLLLVVLGFSSGTWGHGRLLDPPGRSTAWRQGFKTPVNYNDNELFCGGMFRQWQHNDGKCGLCGDPWDAPVPRANENGGLYGTGTLVRQYQTGQTITIGVELTANHMGFFEFSLCSLATPSSVEKEECFQKHPLKKTGTNISRFDVSPGIRNFNISYDLPEDLKCSQCVIQWRYIAGNNWGWCEDGTGRTGCGPQEEFRSCADIRILNDVTEPLPTPPSRPSTRFYPVHTHRPTLVPKYPETTTQEQRKDESMFSGVPGHSAMDILHSPQGQIVALTFAFIFVFLIIGILLFYLHCGKHWLKQYFKHPRHTWSSKIPASILTASMKTSQLSSHPSSFSADPVCSATPSPPPVPPRRHRTRIIPIVISPPTMVSINGVKVHNNVTKAVAM